MYNTFNKKTNNYNIDNLPLFIYLWYWENNTHKYAHIKTHDFKGIQDAQIGDFGENWYIRPKKATNRKRYTTLKAYKTACSLSLKKFKKDIVIDCITVEIDSNNKIYEKI